MAVNVQVNPLESLIQGFQVGQQLTPAALQQRNLSNQLALQLQQIQVQRAQQQLNDLMNPDAALSRQIRAQLAEQALNPASGVVVTPASLAGQIEARPGALSPQQQALLESRDVAAQEAGIPVDMTGINVPRGTDITPILNPLTGSPTGLARDLTSQIQAAQQQAEISRATRGDQFLNVGGRLVRVGAQGGADVLVGKAPPTAQHRLYVNPDTNEADYYVPGSQPEGFQAYVRPVGSTVAGRTLTPNARILEARKAGESGASREEVESIISGFPEAESAYLSGLRRKDLGLDLKPGAEESRSFRTSLDVGKTLDSTIEKVTEFQATGKFPGITQTAINQFLSTRPDTVAGLSFIPGGQAVYSAFQRSVRNAQTPESRELEMRRALLTSTILRAQAGLAQTGVELQNLLPYTPQINDSEESLVDKLNFLKGLNDQQLSTFREIYPSFRRIGARDQASPTTSAVTYSTPATVRTREEYNALPPNTPYIDSKGNRGVKR